MATRANWKGTLKVGTVSCPVALYTAASTAERVSFHILNRKTGHRVHRQFVDEETTNRRDAKLCSRRSIPDRCHRKSATTADWAAFAGGRTVTSFDVVMPFVTL